MGKKIYRVLNKYTTSQIIIIGSVCFIAGAFIFNCNKENGNNTNNRRSNINSINSISSINQNELAGYILEQSQQSQQSHQQSQQSHQQYQQKSRDKDVFYDIYQPPLRDDNCSKNASRDMRDMGMPINVQTQHCSNASYRQVGILTRQGLPPDSQNETILPLFGRPLIVRRDKWNFYSVNDKNNMIKLPVTINGQSGTNEYGCDNVYDKDLVYVKGFNKPFIFTAYDEEYIRYIP